MDAELQTHVAFHLTGRAPGAGLEPVDRLDLRPALLARYRDLSRLRYDYPLVLAESGAGKPFVAALSGIVDDILHGFAHDADAERMARHVLRLEREIRTLVAAGKSGSLATLWDEASRRLATSPDAALQKSLGRARAALAIDGKVVDCDAGLSGRLVGHAWRRVQREKERLFTAFVDRLCLSLSDILRADFVRSDAGRSPDSLRASIGGVHADDFDFGAMSRMLGATKAGGAMPPTRRQRIERVLGVLGAQRFFAVRDPRDHGSQPYCFAFDNCAAALTAYRQRLPQVTAFAQAIAIAELEIAGEYRDAKHDRFFEDFGADEVDPHQRALFPDYLVCVNAATLDPVEHATLMEILSAGLPMKVLVQTDDILDESQVGDGHVGLGTRSRSLANMVLGLNDVYVLQATGSHLFQYRDPILRGLNYPGPALFSVFSGANGEAGDLPPYLVAAAAMESRAFPAFTYDPSAGGDWASRFDLAANPQADRNWPIHDFTYEDDAHQRISDDLAFTLVDFAACDRRCARHFARVPRLQWSARMHSVADNLEHPAGGVPDKVPCLLMVDNDNVVQRVIVDEKLLREARRCRDQWHSLQELGGIHNSHAERLLARERAMRQEAEVPAGVSGPAQPVVAAASPAASEAVSERSPDEPYIESARCTTCNECTNINAKMFAYNENKQAYIANIDAGTYAQLVEAAESCQVSIIHPGKPRNPDDPAMRELMQRAEAFR